MKIKVSSGFSGKIPTGSFQNSNPSFYAELEYDLPEGVNVLDEVDRLQKELHKVAYQNFKVVADSARVEKLKNDLKGFRFYKTEKGDYPSVTTILDPEFKPYCTEDELRMAIAEGNINHARAAHFIAKGEWVDPKTLDGVVPDLLVCKGKFMDSWDFPAFLKKYPLKDLKNGHILVNHEYRYAGTNDGECLYPLGGEKTGEIVPTIFDFKRTPDKDKNFAQMAGYAKCLGMDHIKQMMIIPTNPDNQQMYSKPIISTSIDKYFEVFADKRQTFLETYGI